MNSDGVRTGVRGCGELFDHGLRDGGDDPAEEELQATWASRLYREGASEGVQGAAFHGPRWDPHGELDGEAGGKPFSSNDGKGDAPEVGGFDGELDAAAASTRGIPEDRGKLVGTPSSSAATPARAMNLSMRRVDSMERSAQTEAAQLAADSAQCQGFSAPRTPLTAPKRRRVDAFAVRLSSPILRAHDCATSNRYPFDPTNFSPAPSHQRHPVQRLLPVSLPPCDARDEGSYHGTDANSDSEQLHGEEQQEINSEPLELNSEPLELNLLGPHWEVAVLYLEAADAERRERQLALDDVIQMAEDAELAAEAGAAESAAGREIALRIVALEAGFAEVGVQTDAHPPVVVGEAGDDESDEVRDASPATTVIHEFENDVNQMTVASAMAALGADSPSSHPSLE